MKKKLSSIVKSQLDADTYEKLFPVIENVEWMQAKLDDTRNKIAGTSVAIPYDNGGGQTGIRENPLFKGYESLWKSYISGVQLILSVLPKDAQVPQADAPKTVLQLVRAKKKGA